MSRKGKLPIALPKGTEVKFDGKELSVKGPKGAEKARILPFIDVKVEGDEVVVSLRQENPEWSKYHGLYRSLIANMIEGVNSGFECKLEMIGVGYRAVVQGNALDLQIGLSHPTVVAIPQGIKVAVDKNTTIVVTGTDKQKVGQFAADIRSKKPPEPYQGKGIRYAGEFVRKKAGKAAAAAKAK